MPSAAPSWPPASGGSGSWKRRFGSYKPIATGRVARSCTSPPARRELFNEAETIAELNEVLGTEVSLKATPQREDKAGGTKPGRKAIAAHLPRVAIVHDLPKDDRHCACGSTLVEIGSEVSEQLDYVPPKIQVLQHVRKKYACPGCEQCVKTAPLPAQILPEDECGARAAGPPGHQQVRRCAAAVSPGGDLRTLRGRLPRATQAAWIIALAERVQPLINLMDERLRAAATSASMRRRLMRRVL